MDKDSVEKFKKYTQELTSKRHPILPQRLQIQIKDTAGDTVNMENILCHLKVFTDSLSWHNYSFIPTDKNGWIDLDKEQIIENTQLKHSYDSNLPLDNTPVKFEFFIMDKALLQMLIQSTERTVSEDLESIKADLRSRGLNEEQITEYLPGIQKKMKEDAELLSFLKMNANEKLDYNAEKSRVTGSWDKEGNYKYELILHN